MGYNPDNPCPVCGSCFSDNIPFRSWNWICRGCGNNFDNKNQIWEKTK
jgi:hypothetical protein